MLLALAACGPSLASLESSSGLGARCRLGQSQNGLLVTEWSGAEKANLETLLGAGGGVAVAFSGCDLYLLPECRLPGRYYWQRTTPTSDLIEIESELELFTKIPLGAVKLAGELARWGRLLVETTISGQVRLEGLAATEVHAGGACGQATHVVTAVSLGAFSLATGTRMSGAGSVDAVGVGEVGGKGSRSTRVLRTAGLASACGSATTEMPAADCASPVQVFLAPIPGRAPEPGPPGTVQVDFVSASADTRWDVYVDDQATCTTPCSRWIDPERPVLLRTRNDAPDKLRIAELDRDRGPLQITARPTAHGRLAAGITFTSLGGLAVITGITLTAIGFGSDVDGMGTAGLITLGAGGLATFGGIWMMLDSVPRAKVRPLFETGGVSWTVVPAPAGVAITGWF
jgi:hypothetical protein